MACRLSAIDLKSPARIDRSKCDRCGDCAIACPGKALRLVGVYWPVDKLAEFLLRDAPFFHHSGGGVTLSGGDCTLYPDYLEQLLKLLRVHHIHIVLETAGHFDYQVFRERVLPYIDLIYFDVKFADPRLHRKHTGRVNGRIVENLKRLLAEDNVAVLPRVPLVPGVTATDENLRSIARLLREVGADEVSLLPYNPLGIDTWGKLGKTRPPLPSRLMSIQDKNSRSRVRRRSCRRPKYNLDGVWCVSRLHSWNHQKRGNAKWHPYSHRVVYIKCESSPREGLLSRSFCCCFMAFRLHCSFCLWTSTQRFSDSLRGLGKVDHASLSSVERDSSSLTLAISRNVPGIEIGSLRRRKE